MEGSRVLAIVLLVFCAPLVHSQEPASRHIQTVEKFIAAFNAHDSSAMAGLVAEDVDWLSIDGDKVDIETRGKSALVESMNAYFKSCPTCQSTLSGAISTPGRVSVVEIANWQGSTGPRSQRGLAVYEFSESLIRRVYYFAAEKQVSP